MQRSPRCSAQGLAPSPPANQPASPLPKLASWASACDLYVAPPAQPLACCTPMALVKGWLSARPGAGPTGPASLHQGKPMILQQVVDSPPKAAVAAQLQSSSCHHLTVSPAGLLLLLLLLLLRRRRRLDTLLGGRRSSPACRRRWLLLLRLLWQWRLLLLLALPLLQRSRQKAAPSAQFVVLAQMPPIEACVAPTQATPSSSPVPPVWGRHCHHRTGPNHPPCHCMMHKAACKRYGLANSERGQ